MYDYNATVIRWIDGDTVDLRVDLGFKMWAETRFRLYGVDAPERGQKNHDEAWHYAESLAPAGSAVIALVDKPHQGDKYGRWLVQVIYDGKNSVNDQLLIKHLAVPYFGGHKGDS